MCTSYVGLRHAVHPLIQNSSRYISRLKWVYSTQTLTSTETSNFKFTLTFLGQAKRWKSISAARQKRGVRLDVRQF